MHYDVCCLWVEVEVVLLVYVDVAASVLRTTHYDNTPDLVFQCGLEEQRHREVRAWTNHEDVDVARVFIGNADDGVRCMLFLDAVLQALHLLDLWVSTQAVHSVVEAGIRFILFQNGAIRSAVDGNLLATCLEDAGDVHFYIGQRNIATAGAKRNHVHELCSDDDGLRVIDTAVCIYDPLGLSFDL